MYHRILPSHDSRFDSEEPGMIVTPDTFRQQLSIIKQLFTVLPLSEWVERKIAGRTLPKRACAVTFDDGWRDNFEFALPILREQQVPATVFAVSRMVGTTQQFWPNRLAKLLSTSHDHAALRSFDWLKAISPDRSTKTLSRNGLAAMIENCKQISDPELCAHLDHMDKEIGHTPITEPSLMGWPELHQMQASGLVEIGSHTCNHTRLVEGLSQKILHNEIVESRQQLERQLGKPVTLFCYPNGDISAAAVQLVTQHYAAAVTTKSGINTTNAMVHQLKRIGVHEDISNTTTRFEARLAGWI